MVYLIILFALNFIQYAKYYIKYIKYIATATASRWMVPGRISLPVHHIFIYDQELLLRQCGGREQMVSLSCESVETI